MVDSQNIEIEYESLLAITASNLVACTMHTRENNLLEKDR